MRKINNVPKKKRKQRKKNTGRSNAKPGFFFRTMDSLVTLAGIALIAVVIVELIMLLAK